MGSLTKASRDLALADVPAGRVRSFRRIAEPVHGRVKQRFARSKRSEHPLVGSLTSAFGSGAVLGQVPEQSVASSDPGLSTASSGCYFTRSTICDERATESVALGYLDSRFKALNWRADAPQQAAWYATLKHGPSWQATEPIPARH